VARNHFRMSLVPDFPASHALVTGAIELAAVAIGVEDGRRRARARDWRMIDTTARHLSVKEFFQLRD
jgi:hypothetical protein